MNYKKELYFTMKVLRNMQIDSHIIPRSSFMADNEKTYSGLLKITGHNTINIITDESMYNYIVFLLPSAEEQKIFICGPFRDSAVLPLISALSETIWGGTDNFRIKNHTSADNRLTETEKNYSFLKYSVHVQQAISIIDSDLTADLSLKSVSSSLGMNESYISTLFRKETGKTFTDFVNARRIEQAKKLLNSTSLQIQTIAQHCGILDVNYFTKLFRKYTGFSPSAFRNSR